MRKLGTQTSQLDKQLYVKANFVVKCNYWRFNNLLDEDLSNQAQSSAPGGADRTG